MRVLLRTCRSLGALATASILLGAGFTGCASPSFTSPTESSPTDGAQAETSPQTPQTHAADVGIVT